MTHVTASFTQATFAGYADGTEAASVTKGTNTNFTQDTDTLFLIRFLVQEDAGGTEANKTLQLEYNYNSGGWNNVTASSSVVQSVATTNIADGADTTQRLGAGTYITPNGAFDEVDGLAGDANLDYAGNDEVEALYSVQILRADIQDGLTLQLRVVGLDSYTNTPTITVNALPVSISASIGTLASAGLAATVTNLGDEIYPVASDSAVETSGATSLTIPYPSGLQADDIAIASIQWSGGAGTPTIPTGWNQFAIETGVSNPQSWGLYRVCTGSEGANETFSWTNSITSGGIISLYRYADTTTPIDVTAVTTAQATASASPSLTGVTTVTDNAMVIMSLGPNSGSVTYTPDSPVIEREETPTGGRMVSHGSYILATAGATGSLTGTFSGSREYSGWATAIRAASGDVAIQAIVGTLVSSGQAASVDVGAVSVDAIVGTLASAGQSATINNVAMINANVGVLASSGLTASVSAGAVSINANVATLVSAGQPSTIQVGAVSVAANIGTLASLGHAATITNAAMINAVIGALASAGLPSTIVTGAVSVQANNATLISSGQASSISVGAVTINASAGLLASSGQVSSIVAGAISVQATIAALSSLGHAANVTVSASTINAIAAVLASNGFAANIQVGAVSISANHVVLSSGGLASTVNTITVINASVGAIVSSGYGATLSVGAVSVNTTIAVLASNGETATISVVVSVSEFVDLIFTANRDSLTFSADNDTVTFSGNRDSLAISADKDSLDITANNDSLIFVGDYES